MEPKYSHHQRIPSPVTYTRQRRPPLQHAHIVAIVSLLFIILISITYSKSATELLVTSKPPLDAAAALKCSIANVHKDLSFLVNAKPIKEGEFLERRDRLAAALLTNKIDAFVIEPGYTFQYVFIWISRVWGVAVWCMWLTLI